MTRRIIFRTRQTHWPMPGKQPRFARGSTRFSTSASRDGSSETLSSVGRIHAQFAPSARAKNQIGQFGPMVAGVSEEDLGGLRPFVIQVQVMLPSEADTAVDLHAAVGDFA